jgi:hypothetical protein
MVPSEAARTYEEIHYQGKEQPMYETHPGDNADVDNEDVADDKPGFAAKLVDENEGQESDVDDNHLDDSMDVAIATVLLILHIQQPEATIWATPAGGTDGVRRKAMTGMQQATSEAEHNYEDLEIQDAREEADCAPMVHCIRTSCCVIADHGVPHWVDRSKPDYSTVSYELEPTPAKKHDGVLFSDSHQRSYAAEEILLQIVETSGWGSEEAFRAFECKSKIATPEATWAPQKIFAAS